MTATTNRLACPVCDIELEQGAVRCPECQTDLMQLSPDANAALDRYSKGIDLARGGNRQEAIEEMRGALDADSTLVDGYIVLGKLLAQSGTDTDLQQAISLWHGARAYHPTAEQTRKIDHCTEAAKIKLRMAETIEAPKPRKPPVALAVGGLALVSVCGVAAFLLTVMGLRSMSASAHTGGQTQASRTASNSSGSTTGGYPANADSSDRAETDGPNDAYTNSNASTTDDGSDLGNAEKDITPAPLKYAAVTGSGQAGRTNNSPPPASSAISPARVQHMLQLFVEKHGRVKSSPLHNSVIKVTGGNNHRPLKISGTCTNPRAAAEFKRLVKEIYPTASPVDTSGLIVSVRGFARKRSAVSVASTRSKHAGVRAHRTRQRIAAVRRRGRAPVTSDNVYINLSQKTYTVQPGDTIFAITHKYGRSNAEWKQLYQTNRYAIKKPNLVAPGTKLTVPEGWTASKPQGDDNE